MNARIIHQLIKSADKIICICNRQAKYDILMLFLHTYYFWRKKMEILDQDLLNYAATTKSFIVGEHVLDRLPKLLADIFPDVKTFGIIADENTYRAAGEAAADVLQKDTDIVLTDPLVFPGKPTMHADYSYIPKIKAYIRDNRLLPVAVGSGTINDLVKRAAFEADTPYVIIATAASVDGYASDGAALLESGFKHTLTCPAPAIIAADAAVLNNAPKALNAAGYADLMAKIPGGADWLIADILGEDPIEPTAWKIVQKDLRDWITIPADMNKVFAGLTACGFSMQYMKDSRPVSGAEHLFSHVWEMEGLEFEGEPVSHGFKVGIGSLLSTALMEEFLQLDITEDLIAAAEARYPTLTEKAELLHSFFGDVPGIDMLEEIVRTKYPGDGHLHSRLELLLRKQDAVRRAVSGQLFSYDELRSRLQKSGCPVTPEEIGLSRERALAAVKKAQLLRNRYTIIDLMDDLGVTDQFVEKVDNSSVYLH